MEEGNRYAIYTAGDPSGYATFYAGRVPDGRGIVAGECWAGLLVLWFDEQGCLIHHVVVPLELDTDRTDNTSRIQAWLAAENFRAERIEVEMFSVDGPGEVGVSDYPWGFEPRADETDPERSEFVRRWEEDEGFVVHWGGANVWLNKHGAVST